MTNKQRPPAESEAEDLFRASVTSFLEEHREIRLQLHEANEEIEELKARIEALEIIILSQNEKGDQNV